MMFTLLFFAFSFSLFEKLFYFSFLLLKVYTTVYTYCSNWVNISCMLKGIYEAFVVSACRNEVFLLVKYIFMIYVFVLCAWISDSILQLFSCYFAVAFFPFSCVHFIFLFPYSFCWEDKRCLQIRICVIIE